MTDLEIKVMKEVYGLEHIDDLEQLRSAIRARFERMNAIDRIEIQMRIGRKMQEALAATPGSVYTPASRSLLFTALFMAALAAGVAACVLKTEAWMIFRIAVGLIAFILFAGSCRAVARVIYRAVNRRDF